MEEDKAEKEEADKALAAEKGNMTEEGQELYQEEGNNKKLKKKPFNKFHGVAWLRTNSKELMPTLNAQFI